MANENINEEQKETMKSLFQYDHTDYDKNLTFVKLGYRLDPILSYYQGGSLPRVI